MSKLRRPTTSRSLDRVDQQLSDDPVWRSKFRHSVARGGTAALHLAVFVEPYLQYVLDGRKTIESRFSVVRCAPYRRVHRGDLVLLKRSGGPVVGICEVGETWFYNLDPKSWRTIRREFSAAICADSPEFWAARERAAHATLLQITASKRIVPLSWPKRDRRGWVILAAGAKHTLFEDLMNTTVIAFAGAIASGKSTISSTMAEQVGWPRVTFGGYVRTIARLRGLPETRDALQQLGESLVEEDARQFCVNVLAQAAWDPGKPLIVDGVRHARIAQVLQEVVRPSEFRLVFVDTNRANRQARLRARDGIETDIAKFQRHSTEVEVESSLRRVADLVVDGNDLPENVVREIVRWSKTLP